MSRDSFKEKKGVEKEKGLPRTVQMLTMHGDIDKTLSEITSGQSKKKEVIRRTLETLIGLSLKGYEGKAVGSIFLIGDIEGIRRYTSQMIINPFRGWKDINILDEKQQLTFESFCQLDGAFVLDHRGFAHYAGRMIHVKGNVAYCDHREKRDLHDKKGAGTRWRAAKYVTEKTKTVAVALSHRGDITIFERGKEIGHLKRRVSQVDPAKLDLLVMDS